MIEKTFLLKSFLSTSMSTLPFLPFFFSIFSSSPFSFTVLPTVLSFFLILNSLILIGLILNQNESLQEIGTTQASTSFSNPLENYTSICIGIEFFLLLLKTKNI